MTKPVKALLAAVCLGLVLQAYRPGIPNEPARAEVQAPDDIKHILQKGCYSCHSNEVRLAWFDQVAPAYWLVRRDILTAREHLNFSNLGEKPAAAQKGVLYESVNMMQLGAMPLAQFSALHPEARVTPDELMRLKAYLAPWTGAVPQTKISADAEAISTISLKTVPAEWNGLAFDPDFKKWKFISATDRGDNNSFRFILGNDTAFQAVQRGQIAPWPDGSRLAKIAWLQERDQKGLNRTGKFIQVELMVKDAARYRQTDGWGWGRWRGPNLKPYGEDADFVKECTGCHLPVRGADYVYTLPVTKSASGASETVNNAAAALPAGLPYQPLGWDVVTMYVDRDKQTMSVLFRDGQASQMLALVTWQQREDPHWFGARIPFRPLSVEFLRQGPAGQDAYQRFGGDKLNEEHLSSAVTTARVTALKDLAPANLP